MGSINATAAPNTLSATAPVHFFQGFGGANSIVGDTGNDEIFGGQKRERASGKGGKGGNISLYAGLGDDFIYGIQGDDYLCVDIGAETLNTGDGLDEFSRNNANDRPCNGSRIDVSAGARVRDWTWGQAGNDTLFDDRA